MPFVVSAAAIWLATNVGVLAATQWAAALFFVAKAAAFYAISRALSPKLNAPSLRAMATQVNVRDPAAPRQIIWGQRRVSGVLYPVGTSGTNNEYLHLLLLLADHECDELGDVTFNDQVVPLDGSGNATGTYAGFVRIKKHLGAYNQTVDTDLQADLGSSYWPSTCKGGGIAYLYIRLKMSATLFPGGIPEIYCLVKGRKIFNPGDVAQSDTDATTWTWSRNAALVTYDWVRGVRTRNSAGTLVANYGVGAAKTEVDETVLEDSANNCEENVVLADASTEHRYYANGTLLTSVKAGDGLDILKSAMAGDVVFSGGKWLILSGYYRTPTLSAFGEGDLRAPLKGVRLKPALADLCNVVRGVFISAQNSWQPADLPQVKNATYKTEDGGEDFPTDVELQMTTSAPTGQRLLKIILERSRQGITFMAPCKLGAWRVRPGDVILWTDEDFGWSSKPFEVLAVALAIENDANGQPYLGVDLTLKETASGVWDWANGEETTVDLALNTTLRSPFDVAAPTGLGLTITSFKQPNDGNNVPQLKVSWTAPADAYVTTAGRIRIQYKKHSDSDWIEWSAVKGDQVFEYITAALVFGTAYDVQIRSENQLDQPSAWVQSLNFTITGDTTAPSVPTGLAATVGTGKSVSLDWDDNTDADFSEYAIYRSTTSSSTGFSKIAEAAASRFVDVDVTIGTQYWYRISAIDYSENESSPCTAVTATPTFVGSGSVDATAPSTPSAPTYVSEGTYDAGNGGVFAQVTIACPALPAGAKLNQILHRVSGSTAWTIDDELFASGNKTVDDLTPGIAYEFAVRAISFSNVPSTVSSTLSRTAPNKTAGPGTPGAVTYTAGNAADYGEMPAISNNGIMLSCKVEWGPPADADVVGYEWVTSSTDSTGAADAALDPVGPGYVSRPLVTSRKVILTADLLLGARYFRVRSVNSSGVRSSWAGGGTDVNSSLMQRPISVGTSAGTLAAGNDTRIVNAVQTSRTINGYDLSANRTLAASDVGAVPTARTVNGKALSSNITITPSDVGASQNDIGNLHDTDQPTFAAVHVNGIYFTGYSSNLFDLDWDGANVRTYVDNTLQGTVPNP